MSEIIETRVNYNELSEIESFCPSCEKNGMTRILFCKIPFFGDVIVSSFHCEHCHLKNTELQSAKDIQDNGKRFQLKVTKPEDLQRMVVASNHCKVIIPELDFEVPNVKKGCISTVEGLFDIFITDLELQQPVRKIMDVDNYTKIDEFIQKLKKFVAADPECLPFYFILEDPSGNSFMENPNAPLKDMNLNVVQYTQSKADLIKMGFAIKDDEENKETTDKKEDDIVNKDSKELDMKKKDNVDIEVPETKKNIHYGDKEVSEMISKMHNAQRMNLAHKVDKSMPSTGDKVEMDERLCIFEVGCYTCGKESEMRTFQYEIPFFKEVIIMSFKCEHCGYKNVEVKIGGEVSANAKQIIINCQSEADLNRDIFKSDTAYVKIKELDFEMMPGSLGSFYTTIEGLFGLIIDRLNIANPFRGDSTEVKRLNKYGAFIEKLKLAQAGKIFPLTIEFDDPMDNCFVMNPNYPNEDPLVEVKIYKRTEEQNSDLGIDLIKE